MATRKTTATKSASTKKSTAAGKSSTATADPSAAFRDAMTKPLKSLSEQLQNLKVSGAASAVIEGGRKDLAALVKANEKSYKGLQAVVARQTEMLRNAITDWQEQTRSMPGKDAKENLAKLDEMGKAAFRRALDDMRELAELAAKSQADAFEIVRQRITDNVEQVSQMLGKARK